MSDTKLLLFRLPKALFVRFLSEWLDIHDVGKLDSAMTTKKHRPEFLQCLKEMKNSTVPVSYPSLYERENFDKSVRFPTNIGKSLSVGDVITPISSQPMPELKQSKEAALLIWISKREIYVETLSLPSSGKEIIESLHLPSVHKLSVDCPGYSQPSWQRYIPRLCPSLEELSVGYDGLSLYSRAVMEDLLFVCSQCLQLKNVSIESLSFGRDWRDRKDDLLVGFQEFGHLIVEIGKIDGSDNNVTTQGVLNFLKRCPRLKKLDYYDFEDGEKLLMCAQSCPLLEEISCDRLSKPAVLEVSRNCKQLRKVEFWRFDAEWVELPATTIGALKQIDTLEELSLTGCGLTNEKLAVISGFRHLKHLKLQELVGVDGLTGAGFRVLKGSPISETLQSIKVSFEDGGDYNIPVQGFDIAGMMAGIASCHNLRKADLSYHCDDAGLVVLGAGCPLLEEISLTYGPVTVDGLVDLAEHCQHLTKVVLEYDRNEGRDLEADYTFPEYFDGSELGPGHARAVAAMPIVRSRLPHIQIECYDDFEFYC